MTRATRTVRPIAERMKIANRLETYVLRAGTAGVSQTEAMHFAAGGKPNSGDYGIVKNLIANGIFMNVTPGKNSHRILVHRDAATITPHTAEQQAEAPATPTDLAVHYNREDGSLTFTIKGVRVTVSVS